MSFRPSFFWALGICLIPVSISGPYWIINRREGCIVSTKLTWHYKFKLLPLGLMKTNRPVLTLIWCELIFTNDDYVLRVGSREAIESDTSRHLTPKVLDNQWEGLESPQAHFTQMSLRVVQAWLWDPRLWIKHLAKSRKGDKKWTMPLSQQLHSAHTNLIMNHFSKKIKKKKTLKFKEFT